MNELRQQYSLVWNEVFMLVLRKELNAAPVLYRDVINTALSAAALAADDAVQALHKTLTEEGS